MKKSDILAIVSGKGGTGKASFTVGIAAAVARTGKRVLAIDLDRYPGSIPLYCGIQDRALKDLSDYLLGAARADDVLLQDAHEKNLYLVASAADETCFERQDAGQKLQELIEKSNAESVFLNIPVHCERVTKMCLPLAGRAIVISTQNPVSLFWAASVAEEWQKATDQAYLVLNRLDLSDLLSYRSDRTDVAEMIDTVHLPLLGILPSSYSILRRTEEGLMTALTEEIDTAFMNIAARLSGKQVPLFEGMSNGKKLRRGL